MRDASGPNGPLARFAALAEWVEETIIAYLLGGMTALAFANIIVRRLFRHADGRCGWSRKHVVEYLYQEVF